MPGAMPLPSTTLHAVRNLMLDLGGVLYGVNYHKTQDAFQALAKRYGAPPVHYSQATQTEVFDKFEMGLMTAAHFRDALRGHFHNRATDAEIDQAWNAMLLGLFVGREALLAKLQALFDLAMLSNTNEIHWAQVGREIDPIRPYFKEIFASCFTGMRKPNADIFHFALNHLGWQPHETLFVDDSIQHIHGAQAVGLHAYHLQQPEDLFALADQLVHAAQH